jgi:hypothetical protein
MTTIPNKISREEAEKQGLILNYRIFHVNDTAPNFLSAKPAYWTNPRIRAAIYQEVGFAKVIRPDEAFYLTQNLDYAWGGPNDPNARKKIVGRTDPARR